MEASKQEFWKSRSVCYLVSSCCNIVKARAESCPNPSLFFRGSFGKLWELLSNLFWYLLPLLFCLHSIVLLLVKPTTITVLDKVVYFSTQQSSIYCNFKNLLPINFPTRDLSFEIVILLLRTYFSFLQNLLKLLFSHFCQLQYRRRWRVKCTYLQWYYWGLTTVTEIAICRKSTSIWKKRSSSSYYCTK